MKLQPTHFSEFAMRTTIDTALVLHLIAAVGYWWLSPKGFPVDHSRFWLNTILPIVVALTACIGLIGMHRRRWDLAAAVVLCFTAAWLAGAIYGRLAFPVSLRGVWLFALCIAAGGAVCFLWLIRGESRTYPRWLACVMASLLAGTFAAWAQIPPSAATKPINELPPNLAALRPQPVADANLSLGGGYEFDPVAAELILNAGKMRILCRPLMEFERISADGFWSLFARAKRPRRDLTAQSTDSRTFQYSDQSVLLLIGPTATNSLRVTAFTPINRAVFSHLNAFCYLECRGHQQLTLSFSPCPEARIEVLPSDYPVGRPARLAYVDDAQQFNVVEATSGEKGPFRSLTTGELGREDPLTIHFYDDGRRIASVTMDDWSRQACRELSPTAGWRLPMNAIEFHRLDDRAVSPVAIWFTLAATSVGRGYETVGHQGGIYRNRMDFRVDVSE